MITLHFEVKPIVFRRSEVLYIGSTIFAVMSYLILLNLFNERKIRFN